MWRKGRHKALLSLKPFFGIVLKAKYKIKFGKKLNEKNGAIVLCNHVSTVDPILVSYLFKNPVYHMASKDIFQHRVLGKALEVLVAPIPKEKSKSSDIAAIKSCLRVAKENGVINIFPEGNRTFTGKLAYVDPSIVKLIKSLKKPLLILNIEGGYHTDPRWASASRKGKMYLGLKKRYEYDEIKDMDNDELYSKIISDLTVDDTAIDINYKGKNFAENLEKILYICPVCGHMHTIYSKGDNVYCSNCGLAVTHQPNYLFKSDNEQFKFNRVSDWYEYQIEEIKKKEYVDNELIYTDSISVYTPRMYDKKLKLGEGKINLYNDRFEFVLDTDNITIPFDDILGVTLLGKMKMNIYVGDVTYQIFNNQKTNLLKYMHLYYLIKNRKAGNNNEFLGL